MKERKEKKIYEGEKREVEMENMKKIDRTEN